MPVISWHLSREAELGRVHIAVSHVVYFLPNSLQARQSYHQLLNHTLEDLGFGFWVGGRCSRAWEIMGLGFWVGCERDIISFYF